MTTVLQPPLPSHPVLRLRLAPHGNLPRAIDGAWWPRSYGLPAELPGLLAGLPRQWGHITSATVNGAAWSAVPGRLLVSHEVVRLRRTRGNPPRTPSSCSRPAGAAGICWSCRRTRASRRPKRSWRPPWPVSRRGRRAGPSRVPE